jgi:Protein of unknown function (DUF3592)
VKWLVRHLRGLQTVLMGLGIATAFGSVGFHLAFGSPMKLVGLGFFVAGLSLVLPRALAAKYWEICLAKVHSVEGDDPPNIVFMYDFAGKQYFGTMSETSSKRVGDYVSLFVNPKNPKTCLPHTFVSWFLGIFFVLAGLAMLFSNQPIWQR